MARPFSANLSRRERQILEILYRKGQASVQEVMEELSDAPSYSAVRGLLRVMEQKGHVQHWEDGPRYLYMPVQPHKSAALAALEQVVQTFFGGSVEETVTSLLSETDLKVSDTELDRLAALIEQAREGGN